MKSNLNLKNPQYVRDFAEAEPYPHLVLDGFFDRSVSDNLYEQTASIKNWIDTHVYKDQKHIANRLVADYSEIKGGLQEAIDYLYGEEMMAFVSSLVGVEVFRDPMSLRGGGLQRAIDGAYLDVHLDNCWHPRLEAWTVANCLYYLSSDWQEEYGGHLELWNKESCVKK